MNENLTITALALLLGLNNLACIRSNAPESAQGNASLAQEIELVDAAELHSPKQGLRFSMEVYERNVDAFLRGAHAKWAFRRDDQILVENWGPQVAALVDEIPDCGVYFFSVPESVCVPDGRVATADTSAPPSSGVCQLVIDVGGGRQARGTGWFVAQRVIVTAGHCVHRGMGGNYFSRVTVIPGMSKSGRPFGEVTVSSERLRASIGWTQEGSELADYGVILLPENAFTGGSISPYVFRAAALPDDEILRQPATLSGYPADKQFGTQWHDSGPIQALTPARLLYSIDTFGGHSGSGVFQGRGEEFEVIGIHNYGGCPNKATRLTGHVLADIERWKAEL